ncbi:MAG TPA: SDR family NAD(P)-dependent oxidoreductase [Candidatus Acidoferrales bacterium]|jgi:NAD(P)-dependent dehydrogenase (short-subunit alcohol dehydrogenase family)|nr:SDR family NAD(P)-dependent oxidoreductase [Candidatus Acidoferrales bacterium]
MIEFSSLFRLDGRVAFVAGAASGIGMAAAQGLAAVGAVVVCADLDPAGAARTAAGIRQHGGQADSLALDITDGAAVADAFRRMESQYHQIHVAVSTPAVNIRKPMLSYSDAEFEKVLRLNLGGAFHVLQAAGRHMSAKKAGSIILFSSIRAVNVEPGQSIYAGTKAALVQMARGLASELGPDGVRVNCIAPGIVETPLTAPIKNNPEWYRAYADRNALRRWAKAEEMAGPVLFLASDASSYVTGTVLFADGGWTAIDGRFTPPL